jgi:hypothetical protein
MSTGAAAQTLFQITVSYVKPRGWLGLKKSSPAFPAIEGWILHPGGKAAPDGRKEVSYRGDSNLPAAMETLFSYLAVAVKKGEIEAGFDVKLFEQR